MARTRTTKAVAQRIDLNYFKRTTRFKRAKLWLALAALAIALVWIATNFLAGDRRDYSSGRLSNAHAVLEKRCEACHIRQAGAFSAEAKDSACLACHDGPPHHLEQALASAPKPGCADCHTEHGGRARLAVDNRQSCAQCHSRLNLVSGETNYATQIRNFATGHPEFRALREKPADPGTIRLNHALHSKPIRRGPNGPTVRLFCSDCHRPALTTDTHWEYGDEKYAAAAVSYTAKETFEPVGSLGLPAKRPWSDRQLMAPVKFANACAGCHSLAFDKRFEEGVPHDRPEIVHAYLVKRFSDYIAAHPAEVREVQSPARILAGHGAGSEERTASPARWVADRVLVAEELLWHKTCAQCHAISDSQLQDVRIARWDAAGPRSASGNPSRAFPTLPEGKLPLVAPARITLQWLPHARFDHDAHTGFSCTGCHASAPVSTESSDLLIPGIALCQTCHAARPG
ncbi:MAG TPA: hypothetical protein VKB24_01030, partial [Candidatus Acidoferrum sp.]|nr:hypothetical protein [Candidatus Acidoferrum sp.]